jgi:seryl-tRNA synthetase
VKTEKGISRTRQPREPTRRVDPLFSMSFHEVDGAFDGPQADSVEIPKEARQERPQRHGRGRLEATVARAGPRSRTPAGGALWSGSKRSTGSGARSSPRGWSPHRAPHRRGSASGRGPARRQDRMRQPDQSDISSRELSPARSVGAASPDRSSSPRGGRRAPVASRSQSSAIARYVEAAVRQLEVRCRRLPLEKAPEHFLSCVISIVLQWRPPWPAKSRALLSLMLFQGCSVTSYSLGWGSRPRKLRFREIVHPGRRRRGAGPASCASGHGFSRDPEDPETHSTRALWFRPQATPTRFARRNPRSRWSASNSRHRRCRRGCPLRIFGRVGATWLPALEREAACSTRRESVRGRMPSKPARAETHPADALVDRFNRARREAPQAWLSSATSSRPTEPRGERYGAAQGEERDKLRKEMGALSARAKELDAELQVLETEIEGCLLRIPNLPDPEVAEGASDKENVEVRKWGEPPRFDFAPRDHIQLGEALDLSIFAALPSSPARGTTSEERRRAPRARGATLRARRLVKKGFAPRIVPTLVNRDPSWARRTFRGRGAGLRLREGRSLLDRTSEVPVTAFTRTRCSRRASCPASTRGTPLLTGASGAGERHERTLPDPPVLESRAGSWSARPDEAESKQFHQFILANSEELLQKLGLPYAW